MLVSISGTNGKTSCHKMVLPAKLCTEFGEVTLQNYHVSLLHYLLCKQMSNKKRKENSNISRISVCLTVK